MACQEGACQACLSCRPGVGTYHQAASLRSKPGCFLADFEEWWPNKARTPLPYLLIHTQKLQRWAALHASDPKLWRDAGSETPPAASALRAARALPALAVKLPLAATGISAEDAKVSYSGTVRLQLSPPPASAGAGGSSVDGLSGGSGSPAPPATLEGGGEERLRKRLRAE